MQKYFEVLRKCTLFDGIADSDLSAILGCVGAKIIAYDKKETVIAEGESAKYIGIVLTGAVQVIQVDYFGNRSIVSSAGAGEMFGESFACANIRSVPVDVIADEKSEIMFVESSRVLTSCSNACAFHRQLIFNLMRDLADKNIMFHQKVEITSKRSTREKLMAYLMLQAKKTGSKSFTVPFDRQELADYLEVERSGLSAEISKMRREGIIESKKNYFELLI